MTDEIVEPEKPKRATRAATVKADALPKDIISIIPLIRAELGAIAKDQQATAGASYAFRGHDQIVNAIAPLFNKYGVFTTVEDESIVYAGRNAGSKYATASVLRKKVTFHAPDGSTVSSTVVSESVDYGNKSTTQAQTVAYRVALTQTFTIPTGEPDIETNNEPLEPTGEPVTASAPAQPSAPAAGDEITALRESIKAHLKEHGIEGKDPVLAEGLKFFNNRDGFWDNKAALTKWNKALVAGEIPATAKA